MHACTDVLELEVLYNQYCKTGFWLQQFSLGCAAIRMYCIHIAH